MADCECLKRCPFFNNRMGMEALALSFYKNKLCHGDNTDCARYAVFKELGPDEVPLGLYPNEIAKAMEYIESKTKLKSDS